MTATRCQSCVDTGRLGHCAPKRCYCRHSDCYAAAHARTPEALPDVTPEPSRTTQRHADSWATREEPTWLDR